MAEIGVTDVSLALSCLLTVFFVALVFCVPLVQAFVNYGRNDDRTSLSLAEAVELFPNVVRALHGAARKDSRLLVQVAEGNDAVLAELKRWQDDFVSQSWLTAEFLPLLQDFLLLFGTGNEKVLVGRDGWLFYEPGVDYVTSPGFLTVRHLDRERIITDSASPREFSDPRSAVLAFDEYLEERGIQLVLMPAPDKATVVPDRFSRRFEDNDRPIQNGSFDQFRREMEKEGVVVFDVAEELMRARRATATLPENARVDFLMTDSHWNPTAVELSARLLAGFLTRRFNLSSESAALYARGEQRIAATGDLAAMLRLDATNTPVENVTIHPIRRVSGTEPPTGDVLFLGDSYANIFSLAEMGWGGDAGFTEQLSYYLNRPVEGILRNDDGAWATRQMLAAEIYAGRDRLQGKKIVIWEFASRELTAGEWKPIRFPESPGTSVAGGDADTSSVVVRGTIQSVSLAPKPGQQPYKDYIRSLLLTDIQVQSGQLDDKEALIYVWAMRDNVLTPEANWGAGSVVTLRLQPWTSVSARLERVNRGELDDPEVLLYTPWWGEIGEKP